MIWLGAWFSMMTSTTWLGGALGRAWAMSGLRLSAAAPGTARAMRKPRICSIARQCDDSAHLPRVGYLCTCWPLQLDDIPFWIGYVEGWAFALGPVADLDGSSRDIQGTQMVTDGIRLERLDPKTEVI